MRAILVAVDYSDLLRITLPYNRHHFEQVMVVTDMRCSMEVQDICHEHGAWMYATNAFYDDGAAFNKWKALEEGLDVFGRHGWLTIMDADVLWPKSIRLLERGTTNLLVIAPSMVGEQYISLDPGWLCTPRRRMWEEWPNMPKRHLTVKFPAETPIESEWQCFPLHRQEKEFAGYSQIFHADDPVLGPPPWHQVDWKHAGGADSFFQAKWSEANKIRPPFEVLHLGPAGKNWFGRATPNADGETPAEAQARLAACRKIWVKRAYNRRMGRDQFAGERSNPRQSEQ